MAVKLRSKSKNNNRVILLPKSNRYKQLHLFESILKDSMEYVVIYLDEHGTILSCNKSAELVSGYTAKQMIGKNISTLYKPNTSNDPDVASLLKHASQAGGWKGKIKYLTKKGLQKNTTTLLLLPWNAKENSTRFVLITKSHLKSDEIFQLELSQDLLRIKNKKLTARNSKMLEITRLKNEFIANMSHDLRTPLNGIIGFAEIMHDQKVGPVSDTHKEYLGDILSNAQLLLLLINDILDLAKVEAGKMEFNPEEINLLDLVNELRNLFEKDITKKHISLKIDVDPALNINIDPNKLKQVIYNLVSNALKFSSKKGKVTIIARKNDNETFRLEVHDEGIGIRKKDFKKLFIEFQQLESGTNKKYQGTGLGLALTRRIVEAQGGRVDVKSVFSEGSVFSISLPCTPPVDHYGYSRQSRKKEAKVPTILIIEDASTEKDALINLLNTKGYNTLAANTIDEAIDHGQVSHADAIVLDFFISDINKLKLLRAFRCKKPFKKAPALLITGIVSKVEAFGFRIHDFLVKPVEPEELVDALKWSGASPYSDKLVLIIDDKEALQPHSKILKENGYRTVYESDLAKALLVVEKKHPDVLILNPFIESKKMNGFDFLHSLRLTLRGRYTPIVITTLKILDSAERERLKGIIQRVVLKKRGVAKSLIEEISKQYPISANIKKLR